MRALFIVLLLSSGLVYGQYDPAGGELGSRSIHRSDASIESWADSAVYAPGYLQIDEKGQGRVSGDPQYALGAADGGIVSLGDSGMITYYFAEPVLDREGFDFAVFENGFKSGEYYYLELAFVEVSIDGQTFHRFYNASNADTLNQIDFGGTAKPEWYHNLAGKHQAPYGTLFDLAELGLDSVRYIRIVDVIGTVDTAYASRDSLGNVINDPWPTPFASSGFDLDAVGIVNGEMLSSKADLIEPELTGALIQQGDQIRLDKLCSFEIYSLDGTLLERGKSSAIQFKAAGYFILRFKNEQVWYSRRVIVY